MCSNFLGVTDPQRLLQHFNASIDADAGPPTDTYPGQLSPMLIRAAGVSVLSAQQLGSALVFALLVMASSLSLGADLEGRVVRVVDGDSVTVLDSHKVQHKIRLAGIDAPERRMPYARRSTDNLAELVAGKPVQMVGTKIDRYGRRVAKVLVDGQDASLAQIEAGMAWHYKAYQLEQSADDRSRYDAAEQVAREERRGLWREPGAQAPWEWRAAQRAK